MKRNIITFGLITALGIGGELATSNTKSFADMNNNTSSTTEYSENATTANSPKYLYKDGKLHAYNETEAKQEGAITIETTEFKEGDTINIIVDDSM